MMEKIKKNWKIIVGVVIVLAIIGNFMEEEPVEETQESNKEDVVKESGNAEFERYSNNFCVLLARARLYLEENNTNELKQLLNDEKKLLEKMPKPIKEAVEQNVGDVEFSIIVKQDESDKEKTFNAVKQWFNSIYERQFVATFNIDLEKHYNSTEEVFSIDVRRDVDYRISNQYPDQFITYGDRAIVFENMSTIADPYIFKISSEKILRIKEDGRLAFIFKPKEFLGSYRPADFGTRTATGLTIAELVKIAIIVNEDEIIGEQVIKNIP
ncbi:hypothetical protein ACFL67_02920 [candidate division KSB1 bacterium]